MGRSALAIDTVIYQRSQDVDCVYVLFGQKRSTVVGTLDLLRHFRTLDYTTRSGGRGERLARPATPCALRQLLPMPGRGPEISTRPRPSRMT